MYLHKPCLLAAVVASLVFSQSSSLAQLKATTPRELLAKQPDFVAEEIIFSVEEHGPHGHVSGHELASRKAKKGKFYRTDTGVATFFEDATKPGGGLWFEGAQYAESFAGKEGIKFEFAGTERVREYECIKVKATRDTKEKKPVEDEVVYFYVAKDLRNLVIATQVFTPKRKTTYVLRNISFDIPAGLFKDAPTVTGQTSNNGKHPTANSVARTCAACP